MDTDQRMAELNGAYAEIATTEARAAYDRRLAQAPTAPAERAPQAPPDNVRPRRADGGSGAIDFGRYTGWTIAELARHDPDYLRWLRRHSSGIRYRREIDDRLRGGGPAEPAQRWQRFAPFRSRRSGASA